MPILPSSITKRYDKFLPTWTILAKMAWFIGDQHPARTFPMCPRPVHVLVSTTRFRYTNSYRSLFWLTPTLTGAVTLHIDAPCPGLLSYFQERLCCLAQSIKKRSRFPVPRQNLSAHRRPVNMRFIFVPYWPIWVFIKATRRPYSLITPAQSLWWMHKHQPAVPDMWTSDTLHSYSGVPPIKSKPPQSPLHLTSVTRWQNRQDESSFISTLIFSWVVYLRNMCHRLLWQWRLSIVYIGCNRTRWHWPLFLPCTIRSSMRFPLFHQILIVQRMGGWEATVASVLYSLPKDYYYTIVS